MISLYGGRLLLVCDRTDRNWHARVILGPKPELQTEIDTGTVYLPDALLRGQQIYRAMTKKMRPADGRRMCWDCLQWNMKLQRCDLELPEAKRSGGKYADKCEMFEPAVRAQ